MGRFITNLFPDHKCPACRGRGWIRKIPSAQVLYPGLLLAGIAPEKSFVRCWACHAKGVGFRPFQ